jgi:hypothetical protein
MRGVRGAGGAPSAGGFRAGIRDPRSGPEKRRGTGRGDASPGKVAGDSHRKPTDPKPVSRRDAARLKSSIFFPVFYVRNIHILEYYCQHSDK